MTCQFKYLRQMLFPYLELYLEVFLQCYCVCNSQLLQTYLAIRVVFLWIIICLAIIFENTVGRFSKYFGSPSRCICGKTWSHVNNIRLTVLPDISKRITRSSMENAHLSLTKAKNHTFSRFNPLLCNVVKWSDTL